MEYLNDFENCTIRQSDLNSLICAIKYDVSRYRSWGELDKAVALETAFTHISLLVSSLRGRHAAEGIVNLCRDNSAL